MRWVVRALAPALLVTVLTSGGAPAATAAPDSGATARGGHPAMRTVVVTVRGSGPGARGSGVPALRRAARRSQAPLLARLHGWEARGRARDVTALWISDSITVTALPRVIRRIAARADVVSVRPDRIRLVPAFAPATPNQSMVHAPTLWDLGQAGDGVVVASLDSGVDVTHPDLSARWRGGTNSWYDPYGQHPTTPTDLSGHGTGVTGVMVGGDDGGTTIGSAPGASWIAARVFDDSGGSSVTAVHQAFQWLLDPDGDPGTDDAPQVVNASWSIGAGPGCDLVFEPDVAALRAADIVTVFPAGNFGPAGGSSVSPANYPESVSVGAVSDTGLVSSLSSRGPSTCGGRTRPFPDLVAPGVDILTADRWGLYQYASGTSVAAPHAAGALALLLGARPGLSADQQQDLLLSTATDLGDPGPDDTYGHGLLDAAAGYAALPPHPGTFELAVTPASATVQAGGVSTFDVSVTGVDGFSDDVALSVTGVPSDVAAAFSPASVTGGAGTSTLSLTTSVATSSGTFPLTVSAVGGALSRQATVSLEVTPPPPTDALVLSTIANSTLPGVTGTPDDADLYSWSGSAFRRDLDASAAGLPSGANVDGLDRVDATRFYLSFAADSTWVPGLGKVQDEDVVYYAAGTWSLWFDGTAHGLTASGLDLDAISIDGTTLSFSTRGNVNPPGVGGTADDADVYTWNATSYSRVWDATWRGLAKSTNVDGLVRRPGSPLYLSFAPDTTLVPRLGAVQDEDVVVDNAGTWSVYFDGTVHGLGTSAGLDVDAFDLP